MTVPVEQAQTHPRQRIGRYLVIGRIGRGGMGMVYRGYDESLDREVAIKTLTAEGIFDGESRQRFEIEAKAAARLQHPNILTVYELGEDRGVPYIAMELLPGADLETLLRAETPLLLREKLEIVIQVCRGLAFAHERQIVHRDVKPSNIRILDDGTAKIMDFGIAKLQGSGVTKAGMMVGTVNYMSPEQIRGRSLDGRSDVFSVGVILYEMLSGRRPFLGQATTEVLYKIVHDPAPPLPLPEELGPTGARLQEIVNRTLAKEREDRYPGTNELADDLEQVLSSRVQLTAAPPPAFQALNRSRQLLKDGRIEDALLDLRELSRVHPDSVEIARALRAGALAAARRRESPASPETLDFPELEATFKAPPTLTGSETAAAPVTVPEPARTLIAGRSRVFWAATVVGLTVLILAILLLRPNRKPMRIAVRTQPPGALVLLDGQPTGVTTDGALELPGSRRGTAVVSFRKPGYREESRSLALPARAGEMVAVDLVSTTVKLPVFSDPPGAGLSLDGQPVTGVTPTEIAIDAGVDHVLLVSLEGYTRQQVRLAGGGIPPELRLTLQPAGALIGVQVASTFPLDVIWRGRILARGLTAPVVQLPEGTQTVSLVSAGVFLRASYTVDVKNGVRIQAPLLGRINVRATPDNCEVVIDGVAVGYLPILDRPIAAGNHSVVFKWPDGRRDEVAAEVAADHPAYVMGRKD